MAAQSGDHGAPPSIGGGVRLVTHSVPRPLVEQPPEEQEQECWVEVQFTRPWPGDQDPATRALTAPQGVVADYIIYDHKGNEIKRGKYANKDGSPQRVELTPDTVNVTVRYEHDENKQYEIAHQPQAHGLVDGTLPPTAAQQAAGGKVRIA